MSLRTVESSPGRGMIGTLGRKFRSVRDISGLASSDWQHKTQMKSSEPRLHGIFCDDTLVWACFHHCLPFFLFIMASFDISENLQCLCQIEHPTESLLGACPALLTGVPAFGRVRQSLRQPCKSKAFRRSILLLRDRGLSCYVFFNGRFTFVCESGASGKGRQEFVEQRMTPLSFLEQTDSTVS